MKCLLYILVIMPHNSFAKDESLSQALLSNDPVGRFVSLLEDLEHGREATVKLASSLIKNNNNKNS
jgi:hypothetical protein